ncbi:MAG: alanine:cation symporter family protein [Clostridiales bacterium]|nr:alanine:cation symporter family protein [Clostridiales bacterium]
MLLDILNKIDDILYFPVLIIIMVIAGLYFSFRTKFVQLRLFGESCRLLMEPSEDKSGKTVSSFQALMISTASRVGTGNIVGVSTAICIGGPGACFWMWIMCIITAASAFMESTLAQIFKRKDKDGNYFGGPAYYIEKALHAPWLSVIFCIFLIATYGIGFNLLCAYNLQSSFAAYPFYGSHTLSFFGSDVSAVAVGVGIALTILVAFFMLGGGKRVVRFTEILVPIMGMAYVLISLIVIFVNIKNIPSMFVTIFKDAFDFRSILGGIAGSCLVYGIKRGLYSNEAGVGSAPNASASANVSHPAKQGLVQTLSVYIDTLLLCTATALMCLSTGVERNADVAGAPYVQNAISTVFGSFGPLFITLAMVLFAFTTLLGNLFYVDNALAYLNKKKMPSKRFLDIFHIFCAVIIFFGTVIPMDAAWAVADITMGGMTMINIPACVLLGSIAVHALRDYETQKKAGKNPVFRASNIGLNAEQLDHWK